MTSTPPAPPSARVAPNAAAAPASGRSPADPPAVPETQAPRSRRGRRVAAWITIGLVLLVVGGIGAAISAANQWAERGALDPTSAGPAGTRAIAEILRAQELDVVVARDRDAAADALADGDATLVLPDAPALSDDAVGELTDVAADVVLIEPRARTLDLLLPGSVPAGVAPGGTVAPRCDVPDAERAGAVEPGSTFSSTGSQAEACYPAGDGHGLLIGPHTGGAGEGGRVSVVDGRALFSNEHLSDNGNAALAVNLMGRHPVVVWYVPGLGDTDIANADPSLGELTPPWVSPVIVLLLVAGVAAGMWRGRRFGPLVAERLPVTVRAWETTEGRARLYARSRDALHAADQLRIGALGRLARLLGLGPGASAPEIADAAAGRTGQDRAAVRALLIDEIPASDAELLALSMRLRHLEDAVAGAVRPSTGSATASRPGTAAGSRTAQSSRTAQGSAIPTTRSGTERNPR